MWRCDIFDYATLWKDRLRQIVIHQHLKITSTREENNILFLSQNKDKQSELNKVLCLTKQIYKKTNLNFMEDKVGVGVRTSLEYDTSRKQTYKLCFFPASMIL